VLDVVAAAIGLVVLGPVIATVALLVRVRLGRPVLFHQRRPGREGEIFTIHKFRTLAPPVGESSGDDDAQRLSGFGARLRATSLDELPTLWNVLRGDMSVVGPRPLLVEYLPLYSPAQARRHEVRPGITGLAQVRGRNLLTWPEKFDLDRQYVDERSLALDLRILGETILPVLTRAGVSARGQATMTRFGGDDDD
jgi:lipopolysaccharide/colanic/teichoic acid biosynthesis glycosyltransferase